MKILYVAGSYPYGRDARRPGGSIIHAYRYFRTRDERDAWIAAGQREYETEPDYRYAAAEVDVADFRYEKLLRA